MRELDSRSNEIFEALKATPHVNLRTLESKLSLNRRQINYSINKINSYLDEYYGVKISRTKTGQFILPDDLLAVSKHSLTVLSDQERVEMILLLILNRNEPVSLIHFTSALHLSKSTIVKELKDAKEQLLHYHIRLKYDRMRGYYLYGEEWHKRELARHLLSQYATSVRGRDLLQHYVQISPELVIKNRRRLERCENLLGYRFAEDMLNTISYFLCVLETRVKHEKLINTSFVDEFLELEKTKEYSIINSVFKDPFSLEEEQLYLTLITKGMSIASTGSITSWEWLPQIQSGLGAMLLTFEEVSVVTIPEKEDLINKMLLHMEPAYYRIRYQAFMPEDKKVHHDHSLIHIHNLVKIAVEPLEKSIGKSIPEKELFYLTIIIGGWLRKKGIEVTGKPIAAVVCPNGLSVSRMLHTTLSSMFNQIFFLEPMSIREFSQYQGEVKLVFSTERLDTSIKQFIVDPLLKEEEKVELKTVVLQELYGVTLRNIQLDDVLAIIRKYAIIKNDEELKNDLSHYFFPNPKQKERSVEENELGMLLQGSYLSIVRDAADWVEAIRAVAKPLLANQIITENYVQAVIAQCKKNSKYIMLSNQIAMPHARPEDGVNVLGMSLIKLDKEVQFPCGTNIQVICMIAAVDKERHIRPLLQLRDLAKSSHLMEAIKQASSTSQIETQIKKI